jgi:mRNA interferase MazF
MARMRYQNWFILAAAFLFAPGRALSVTVPLSSQNRGTQYEVPMPRVPWLKHQSFANVQAIAASEHHEFLERRGRFDQPALEKIKRAIRWALAP